MLGRGTLPQKARPEASAWPLRAIPVGSSLAGEGSVMRFMQRTLTKRTDTSNPVPIRYRTGPFWSLYAGVRGDHVAMKSRRIPS
jgi:hypothetical protein